MALYYIIWPAAARAGAAAEDLTSVRADGRGKSARSGHARRPAVGVLEETFQGRAFTGRAGTAANHSPLETGSADTKPSPKGVSKKRRPRNAEKRGMRSTEAKERRNFLLGAARRFNRIATRGKHTRADGDLTCTPPVYCNQVQDGRTEHKSG